MKIRLKDDRLTPNQIYMKNKWEKLVAVANEAGFTLEATELCLMNFFNVIVEECARVAERQSRIYPGESNEGAGCHRAASAIRTYGERLGNNE